MKKLSTFIVAFCISVFALAQPCTTTNGIGCLCPTGIDTCDLYPDIKIAESIMHEADQNPEVKGELRLSISTPNLGYGPLQVESTSYYVCGTDTIFDPAGLEFCPDGSYPRQLIQQIIYRKEGDNMTNYWRWAGSMTYHPTHNHMHVDEWGVFTLRTPTPGEDNPLAWPIVAEGAKLGFCLMDFGSCDFYEGHCVGDDGTTVMTSDNTPNYGLGGGDYSCGFSQGISAGFTDIYHHYLDDMDIQIPDNVCNGEYMLVIEVDPNNNFKESNEDNNMLVMPWTLTQQSVEPTNLVQIAGATTICKGESVTLSTNIEDSELIWSNGATGSAIDVTESGTYFLSIFNECGTATSPPIEVTVNDVSITQAISDTLCEASTATLSVQTAFEGTVKWYDSATESDPIFEGTVFETPELTEARTYYAENEVLYPGTLVFNEPHNTDIGNSSINSPMFNGYLIFDAHQVFELKSVKVFAGSSGDRTFQVRNSDEDVLIEQTFFVPEGESRVPLNFVIPSGTDLQFGTAEFPNMERNNSGVNYPYEIAEVVSLKGSNYDNPTSNDYYYYYFYDWEVQTPDYTCASERMPVEVHFEECFAIGIENAAENALMSITPNPNKGIFQVEMTLPNAQNTVLSLMDISGKIIYTETLSPNIQISKQLNMSHLSAGIYFVAIKNSGKTSYQKMVIH